MLPSEACLCPPARKDEVDGVEEVASAVLVGPPASPAAATFHFLSGLQELKIGPLGLGLLSWIWPPGTKAQVMSFPNKEASGGEIELKSLLSQTLVLAKTDL